MDDKIEFTRNYNDLGVEAVVHPVPALLGLGVPEELLE